MSRWLWYGSTVWCTKLSSQNRETESILTRLGAKLLTVLCYVYTYLCMNIFQIVLKGLYISDYMQAFQVGYIVPY